VTCWVAVEAEGGAAGFGGVGCEAGAFGAAADVAVCTVWAAAAVWLAVVAEAVAAGEALASEAVVGAAVVGEALAGVALAGAALGEVAV
jgi:hypothetical protein